ncbi:hypothetical protein [Snuella lapsa]|uniref:Beta-galactosidase n=1 Tax=Snuella lapsa TaxID=870481 RepID=A0ABP6X1D7_9FLAO
MKFGSDEIHIKNPKEFISKMVKIVEDNDRKAIVWSPGLEADKSVIRQTWGSNPNLNPDGIEEIDSQRSYINGGEPMSFINTLLFKPIGSESHNKVLGGIICLWPDVNLNDENDAFIQNPAYPALLTYAWSTWTADITSAPDSYLVNPPTNNAEAARYFKHYENFLIDHKDRYFSKEPFPYVAQSDKQWHVIGPFNGNDGDDILKIDASHYSYNGKDIKWQKASGNTLVIKARWLNNGYFPEIKPDQCAYAMTYIYSDEQKQVPSWINFETPLRANRVYSGLPDNGKWDANGGIIYLNDKELPGPQWQNPNWKPSKQKGWGSAEDQEIPWSKEELYWTRQPFLLTLNKGWNKIVVKIPYTNDFQNCTFTFIPLDMEGLKFSVDQSK